MKGNNKLILNTATMIEILNIWALDHLPGDVKVANVEASGGVVTAEFTVELVAADDSVPR